MKDGGKARPTFPARLPVSSPPPALRQTVARVSQPALSAVQPVPRPAIKTAAPVRTVAASGVGMDSSAARRA